MAKQASPGAIRREVTAVLLGAAAAALGALILGEYEFNGATPYVAGLLFGMIVAEIALTVAKRASAWLAVTCATEAGLGLAWAVWISSGRGRAPIPAPAYVSIGLGVVVAGGWVAGSLNRRPRVPEHAPEHAPEDSGAGQ